MRSRVGDLAEKGKSGGRQADSFTTPVIVPSTTQKGGRSPGFIGSMKSRKKRVCNWVN